MDGGTQVSLLRYRRLSSAPPPERELLTVEPDGSWTGWRSGGSMVGRFGGRIADPDWLRALADRAAAGDAPAGGELPFDAAYERIEAGGREASLRAGAGVPGAWGELVAWCRDRIDAMTLDPVAAIEVEPTSPTTIRLRHRGTEVLPLELASLSVEVGWLRDGVQVRSAMAGSAGLGRVEAGPGWSLDVAVDDPAPAPSDTITAWAELVVDDHGVYVPVLATVSRKFA